MKKILYSLLAVATIFILQSNQGGYVGAEVASTAATGSGCSGSGCHAAQSAAGTEIEIHMFDPSNTEVTKYLPGIKYRVEIFLQKGNNTSLKKAGFQSAIKTIANVYTTGNISTQASYPGVSVTPLGGTVVARHNTSDVTANDFGVFTKWSYDWTAPALGEGDIQIFTICNDANGNGNSGGDIIKYYSKVYPLDNVAVDDVLLNNNAVYPNPTNGILNINLKSNDVSNVKLYSIAGQVDRKSVV